MAPSCSAFSSDMQGGLRPPGFRRERDGVGTAHHATPGSERSEDPDRMAPERDGESGPPLRSGPGVTGPDVPDALEQALSTAPVLDYPAGAAPPLKARRD